MLPRKNEDAQMKLISKHCPRNIGCACRLRAVFLMAAMASLVIVRAAIAEVTSENNEQLKKWLQQYPAADANHDGVLTESEARAFEKQIRGQHRDGSQSQAEATKPPAIAPDLANVSYGPYRRNVFDLWKPKTDRPAPVFVFFHGGGFMGGDKSGYIAGIQKECLQSGIAFVSADYRLVIGDGAAPFPAPMLDGARVVQFLRARAKEWNLDTSRIAIGGGSAGANISLWVALHDDLANPAAEDPVLRESSRVSCVISWNGQTSNDPRTIKRLLGGPKTDHPALLPLFGVKTREELETPAMRKVVEEASALNHASKDDPPVLLTYGGGMTPLPMPETADWGTVIHHPVFGKLLKDKLDPLGVPCQFYYGSSEQQMPPGTYLQFLKKYLQVAP